VAARACALDPETITIAIARAGLVSGPVASLVFLQQTVVRELIENLSAKNAVQIDRCGFRRPDPKGCAISTERRAGWRLRRNVLLGKHGLLSLQHCYRRQLLRSIGVAFRRAEHRTTRECPPARRRFRLAPPIFPFEVDRPSARFQLDRVTSQFRRARCRVSLVGLRRTGAKPIGN